jgi:hypothetical protein
MRRGMLQRLRRAAGKGGTVPLGRLLERSVTARRAGRPHWWLRLNGLRRPDVNRKIRRWNRRHPGDQVGVTV